MPGSAARLGHHIFPILGTPLKSNAFSASKGSALYVRAAKPLEQRHRTETFVGPLLATTRCADPGAGSAAPRCTKRRPE